MTRNEVNTLINNLIASLRTKNEKKYIDNIIMAFRSPENVQRNELVRFELESTIRAPANAAEQQKMVINSLSTIEALFTIGLMHFLK